MNPREAIAQQMWDYARRLPGAKHRTTAYGMVVTSDVPLGAGNYLVTSPGKQEDHFRSSAWGVHVLGFFGDSRAIPWQLRVPSRVAATLKSSLSLTHVSVETEMAFDLLNRGSVPCPFWAAPLLRDIFPVESQSHLEQFQIVTAKAFNLRGWAVRLAFPEIPGLDGCSDGAHTRWFVANPKSALESTAVGTAAVTTFKGEDIAVVSQVGVSPRYRIRGWGTALTVAAMKYAEDRGASRFVLMASPAGHPLYEGLGFTATTEFTTLENRPPFFDRARNAARARQMAGEVE